MRSYQALGAAGYRDERQETFGIAASSAPHFSFGGDRVEIISAWVARDQFRVSVRG